MLRYYRYNDEHDDALMLSHPLKDAKDNLDIITKKWRFWS